jgi:hypothetical protein
MKAYFLVIFNLLWSAFRHPTKTTVIDWNTGHIVEHY